ncbi:hypothetical protein RRG08_000199 [Elysia crispata]|uniref:Uncharacterized protein n=1 Tax=Elysia crispata TaxID=231223 RepID=A0AAE0YVK4_9GAST|nr:hypothetical protein RRG08_000199 [Elysia crispata]
MQRRTSLDKPDHCRQAEVLSQYSTGSGRHQQFPISMCRRPISLFPKDPPIYREPLSNQKDPPIYREPLSNQEDPPMYQEPLYNQKDPPIYREPLSNQKDPPMY